MQARPASSSLSRKQLAEQAGVHAETLRYYEQAGILPHPPRNGAGARRYPRSCVARVRLIKQMQGLGFALREVRQIFGLLQTDGGDCQQLKQCFDQKIRECCRRLEELHAQRIALIRFASLCPGEGPIETCPVRALMETGPPASDSGGEAAS